MENVTQVSTLSINCMVNGQHSVHCHFAPEKDTEPHIAPVCVTGEKTC